MDSQNILFFVFIGFFVISLPLLIDVGAYLNALANIGVVVVRFWGIPLFCFKFTLSKKVITIIKKKGKEKQIKLDLFDPNILFMRYLTKSIFALTIINYVRLYADLGVKNDAYKASLLSGTLCAIVESLFSILHTKKSGVKTIVDVVPSSSKNECRICVELRILTIPILLVYSLIRAKILTKRWFKLYERYSRI